MFAGQQVAGISIAVPVLVAGDADHVFACLQVGEQQHARLVGLIGTDDFRSFLVGELHDVAIIYTGQVDFQLAQRLGLRNLELGRSFFVGEVVEIEESSLRDGQFVVVAPEQRFGRRDDVTADVAGILFEAERFDGLLAFGVGLGQDQGVAEDPDEGQRAFHAYAQLLYGFIPGRNLQLEGCVHLLFLVFFLAAALLFRFLDGQGEAFIDRGELARGIGLQIVETDQQAVVEFVAGVDPEIETVARGVVLQDDRGVGDADEFQVVDLDIGRAELEETLAIGRPAAVLEILYGLQFLEGDERDHGFP